MTVGRRKTQEPAPQILAADKREGVAIFLGAGASRAFGYPLTSDLLPDLCRFLKDGTLSDWGYREDDQQILRRGLRSLFPGIDHLARRELPLITDILTLIDHSERSGFTLVRGWPKRKVETFRLLLEQVIADMVGPDGPSTAAQERCVRDVTNAVTSAALKHRVGVITTNYDIELELALFRHYGRMNVAQAIDFGMSWRDPGAPKIYQRPTMPKLSFYKLHGSLNWLRCPLCEYIYINVNGVIIGWAAEARKSGYNTCHCEHWPLQSVLVTPSYVRDARDVNLTGIWRNALDLLADADRWILVGYSLPPEDLAIRSLLIKAYRIRMEARNRKPPRIWIVQRDAKSRSRYELLFPNAQPFHGRGIETFDFMKALA